jgi:putative phosphoesterase
LAKKGGGQLRIVVVSDTHRNFRRLENVVLSQPEADLFIHLGDGEDEAEAVSEIYPHKQFIILSGNCDFGSVRPDRGETVIAEKRIFYTHGHAFRVKFGLRRLTDEARRRHADVLLFGHTHVPMSTYADGLHILNPGSLGYPRISLPSYGTVDITEAGIVTNIVKVV